MDRTRLIQMSDKTGEHETIKFLREDDPDINLPGSDFCANGQTVDADCWIKTDYPESFPFGFPFGSDLIRA